MKNTKDIIINKIHFSSVIKMDYYDILERLLFFNKQQDRHRNTIIEFIEKYGEPNIINNGGKLSIKVGENVETHCIFASNGPKLVGVLIYTQDLPENILVLHIAVDEDYSIRGKYSKKNLVIKIVEELKKIALLNSSIKTITICYGKKADKRITIDINC